MIKITFILLFITTTSSLLTGQEIRKIDFTVYGQYPVRGVEYLPVDQTAIALGKEPADPVRIVTHSLARMGPYTFKGGSTISFVESATKSPVAKVRIPQGSEKWLLIFIKNPRHKDNPETNLKYLAYPFNDSLAHLPKNRLIFLNISGKELDGLIEDKRVKLDKGESGSFRVQESLPINLWTRDYSGERLLPALIKTYTFDRNHRYLIIFFPPVLRGSSDLDVRFLSDSAEESN
jgi:hypothetical protein